MVRDGSMCRIFLVGSVDSEMLTTVSSDWYTMSSCTRVPINFFLPYLAKVRKIN